MQIKSSSTVQRSAKKLVRGCEKFLPALAYLPQEKWDWFESSLKKDKIRQKQPNEQKQDCDTLSLM